MPETTDPIQKMQFTMQNYNAQAEKAISTKKAKEEYEKIDADDIELAIAQNQDSSASARAFFESKGLMVDNPPDNHVSFSSITNTKATKNAGKANTSPPTSGVLNRAHAAYKESKPHQEDMEIKKSILVKKA